MNNVLPTFALLIRRSRRSLVYGSIAALTVGLEGLFESIVFNCPCEGHYAYGLAFLWAPALLLFLAGFLVDRDLWRHQPRREDDNKKKISVRRYFKALLATLDVLVRASIAPVAWLVLSFLQQQYYTCAYFGPLLGSDVIVLNATHKCHFKLGSRTRALEESYKTRSQIAGWSLMLIAMSVLFTSVCIRRCIQRGKYLRIPSLEYYNHVEAKAALEQFHTTAKKQAKEKAKREILFLFVKAADKDFISRIQDVEKGIENKYGSFLEIPPESPSYYTPVSAVREAPPFIISSNTGRALQAREPEMDRHETQRSVSTNSAQYLQQTSLEPENASGLPRVRLTRQDSIDASRN